MFQFFRKKFYRKKEKIHFFFLVRDEINKGASKERGKEAFLFNFIPSNFMAVTNKISFQKQSDRNELDEGT